MTEIYLFLGEIRKALPLFLSKNDSKVSKFSLTQVASGLALPLSKPKVAFAGVEIQ